MTAPAALSNEHALNQTDLVSEITQQILTAYDQDQASDERGPRIDLSHKKIENAHIASALKAAFNTASHIMLESPSPDIQQKGKKLLKINKDDTTPCKINARAAQFTNTSFQGMDDLGNSDFANSVHENSDLRGITAPNANTFLNATFNKSAFTLNRFASNIMVKTASNTDARLYTKTGARLENASTNEDGFIKRPPSIRAHLQNAYMPSDVNNAVRYAHKVNRSRKEYLQETKNSSQATKAPEPIAP